MKKIENFTAKASRLLDDIAGWGIVVTMALVVVNILLRTIFKSPIKGVYEYTGYFTALIIGFALAQCAIEKAHIAVDILAEKLNPKMQLVINTVLGSIMIVFLAFSSIQILLYGMNVLRSGEVSATAHIPFYPFIFMVSAGFFILCLVEVIKVIKGVAKK